MISSYGRADACAQALREELEVPVAALEEAVKSGEFACRIEEAAALGAFTLNSAQFVQIILAVRI